MKSRLSILVVALLVVTGLYAQQYEGYTLIAVQNQTTARLIDTNSTVYHTWTGLTGQTGYSSYMLPGGVLLRTAKASGTSFNGGGVTGRFQKVSWTGTILWDVTYSSTSYCMHHDVLPMPNGNVMVIAWESKTSSQVTAAGSSVSHTMWPDKIVEFEQTGLNTYNIVWEWHAWDHLMQNTNANAANYVTSLVDNPQLFNINYLNTSNNSDWLHMNGLDYNEALDQIVVSSHNMNEFYVIDHSTTTAEAASHTGGNAGKGGDILYRWGNPAAYGASGTANFRTVHDAHWVPVGCPRAGYLVGYNNSGVSNSQSSVDMVNPPLNGLNYTRTQGQAFGPTTYDYRHACDGQNNNMGNSEQFPNGNMLVCIAQSGKVYEINAAGTQLWTYTTTGTIPQAHHYTGCFINGPTGLTATASSVSICAGESVQLSSAASGIGTYMYNWSSGAATQNASVSPTTTTTYTVTASLNAGCAVTATVTVNVNQLPAADAGNNVNISSGSSTTLTATGCTGYSWSSGQTTASITVSPASTTTYTVTVTNAGGCTATDAVTVNVTGGNLSASATASSGAICAGENLTLGATGSGGSGNYTYSWASVPSGFTSQLQNPSVTPTASTVYTVTVSDGNVSATASVNVTVNQLAVADAGNDVSISFGSSTTLTATGGGTYAWSNGSNTASITVSPATTTTYTVTVTSASGCSATADVVVAVTGGALSASISATDTTICNGETTQLFVVASGGSGNYTYSWTSAPAGFTSTLSNPYITPSATTTYIVNVSDGVNSVAVTFTVTVLALPDQPTITQNDTLLVSSSATNNQWYYYGSLIANGTGQVLDPDLNGSYQVQVVDGNGCGSPLSDAYEYIHTETGVANVLSDELVNLYPNPASDIVMLNGTALKGKFAVEVYNNIGNKVLVENSTTTIYTGKLTAGAYIMVINLADGKSIRKQFVITR